MPEQPGAQPPPLTFEVLQTGHTRQTFLSVPHCSRPLGEMTQLFLIPPLIPLPGGRRNLHQIDLRCCAHLLGMGVV